MQKRHTIQQALVLDAVKSLSTHPTADEVYSNVIKKCPGISKATVYRNLNTLAEEGKILRVAVANAPDRYDKTLGSHAHFLCRICGRVYDINMLYKLCFDESADDRFIVESYDLIVNGCCKKCKNTEDNCEK